MPKLIRMRPATTTASSPSEPDQANRIRLVPLAVIENNSPLIRCTLGPIESANKINKQRQITREKSSIHHETTTRLKKVTTSRPERIWRLALLLTLVHLIETNPLAQLRYLLANSQVNSSTQPAQTGRGKNPIYTQSPPLGSQYGAHAIRLASGGDAAALVASYSSFSSFSRATSVVDSSGGGGGGEDDETEHSVGYNEGAEDNIDGMPVNGGPRANEPRRRSNGASAAVGAGAAAATSAAGSLDEYLEGLPVISVGVKRRALIECEEPDGQDQGDQGSKLTKLIWLKLVRRADQEEAAVDNRTDHTQGGGGGQVTRNGTAATIISSPSGSMEHDITLLSLGKRLIAPDKRFKVQQQQPPGKWTLTIDNVGPQDDRAYYLCQASGASGSSSGGGGGAGKTLSADHPSTSSPKFIGGARLNVLVPPKIVESETSPSVVLANEYDELRLRCKVTSEPQSQISWRREDGRPLEQLEQRFKHQFERRRPGQLVSIDSSELVFDSIRREQAGAYLCIASNGVLSGVSQRVNLVLESCRSRSAGATNEAKLEPCSAPVPSTAAESQQSNSDNSDRPSLAIAVNEADQQPVTPAIGAADRGARVGGDQATTAGPVVTNTASKQFNSSHHQQAATTTTGKKWKITPSAAGKQAAANQHEQPTSNRRQAQRYFSLEQNKRRTSANRLATDNKPPQSDQTRPTTEGANNSAPKLPVSLLLMLNCMIVLALWHGTITNICSV